MASPRHAPGAAASAASASPDAAKQQQQQEQLPPLTVPAAPRALESEESHLSFFTFFTTYLSYLVLISFGHFRDAVGRLTGRSRYAKELSRDNGQVVKGWERFYTRRLFNRIQDCFARPVVGRPSTWITLAERDWIAGGSRMKARIPASASGSSLASQGSAASLASQGSGSEPAAAQGDANQGDAGEDANEAFPSRASTPAQRKSLVATATATTASLLPPAPGASAAPEPPALKRVLNLGSYNYLGFADDDWSATCGAHVKDAAASYGISFTSGPLSQTGATPIHEELEREMAAFVGKEDAVIFGTGYYTNAWAIAVLAGPGVLVVSDSLNHTSIVNGCRASGALTLTFKHNDARDLDAVIRKAFLNKAERDFFRILVIVEGLYSMEGHMCNLPAVVEVCKRYKAHLYVDEAHSIGAVGPTGRGICELKGVNPADVDVLMGTFTKSFGGLGGYVAASKAVCDSVRAYATAAPRLQMSPVVAAQVLRSLRLLRDSELGRRKLAQLQTNAKLFREGLKRIGCSVLGDPDSPIVPMMIFHPAKLPAFSRECLARGLAVVVVGAPAVPLEGGRARFCISASHTPAELKWALREIKAVCKMLNLRYEKSVFG